MAKKHDLYRSSKDFNNHDGMIIELVLPGGNIDGSTTISPLTDDPTFATIAPLSLLPQPCQVQQQHQVLPRLPSERQAGLTGKKKSQRSAKQASEARLKAMKQHEDYNWRFKMAFKAGTDLLHRRIEATTSDTVSEFGSVDSLVVHLNEKYCLLNGKRKLSKSTLYRALRQGRVGRSPSKRGPPPKIPDILLDVVASHSEVSQVGDAGELRGRDFKRMIGAAVWEPGMNVSFRLSQRGKSCEQDTLSKFKRVPR